MEDPKRAEQIRAVVFDIGGVLLDWNPRHLYRRLFSEEAEMERFLAEICTMEWHHDHDLGMSMAASCERLAAVHPQHAEMIRAWGARTEEMIAGPIVGSVELLRELKASGVRCYALTNMERETFPVRRRRYEFFDWFDGIVVSSHEGVAKPDPEVFRRLLNRFGVHPAATLMIDDSQVNVAAARGVGMQAVRFESVEQLRRVLDEAGLLAARELQRP